MILLQSVNKEYDGEHDDSIDNGPKVRKEFLAQHGILMWYSLTLGLETQTRYIENIIEKDQIQETKKMKYV